MDVSIYATRHIGLEPPLTRLARLRPDKPLGALFAKKVPSGLAVGPTAPNRPPLAA